jgi:hypothetical protein
MYPLTRSGNVEQVEWLDDHSLAVLKTAGDHKPGDAESDEAKAQVYLYEGLVGEGWQVTEHKTGVKWFALFDGGLLFEAAHPERDEKKTRRERFGSFTHFNGRSAPALCITRTWMRCAATWHRGPPARGRRTGTAGDRTEQFVRSAAVIQE